MGWMSSLSRAPVYVSCSLRILSWIVWILSPLLWVSCDKLRTTNFPVSSLWAISGRPGMLVSIWTGIGICFLLPLPVSGGVGLLTLH